MRKKPLAGAAVAIGGALALSFAGAPAHAQESAASGSTVAHQCARPDKPGEMACLALKRLHVTQPNKIGRHADPSGLGPADLQAAYNLPKDGGEGATVAIIDAYDDPNAEADLKAYRDQYGLGAADFQKVNQNGEASPLPTADSGWAGEISLDLDMVSAVAPKAKILLVEADQPSMDDLGTAVNTAVKMGAKYISNSYGGSEDASDTQADDKYFKHPGVAITVSSGDSGYGAEYPAASQYVTSVGGTSLTKDSSDRGWSEKAWDGAGSGESAYDAKPEWQTDATGTSKRGIADVAAVADPATGVAVYDSYQEAGWVVYGGTSASSPIIAGVYADAGTPGDQDMPASYPWKATTGLNDVTSGSNGSCDIKQLCNAGDGWDGPTGLGTPNGTDAFKPAG
ncbi:S53 family peptidase [Actinocatenispora rupis]|uniref:Peptidase S8 n=1 Tax=Actinocatenispora rupis TaxID=519421 RepID=A0A8J3NBI9_9ACTN|nr:S53 family peptidase [Actinocatenispora rupis]GID13116.1 peptidase S8 [Actinocatenispora rupis]